MPFVIAISGASGSGKSTLSAALSDYLTEHGGCGSSDVCPTADGCLNRGSRVTVIPADRYFRPELPKMISPADGKEYSDWNSPESVDYDALCDAVAAARDSSEYEYVIVEGVTILCDERLRQLADLKIYVDASIEMRIYRRIARNVVEKKQTIEFIGGYYLKCARYRESEYSLPSAKYADMHVDNEWGFDINEIGASVVKTLINGEGSNN